ncbi:MAG: cation:proton antiporter [Clostridiales bacterium]|nr:cation:proton antiporter [Clostridiales bacterium]
MINIIFFTLIGLGILFSIYRMIKGPTHFDRVVSLDVINVCIIGILVIIAVMSKNELYLDIAIVYSILGFLETIVFAKFLEVRS